jgi:hypothetical protein
MRAAWEGKSRINLRLLAKAIRGQLQIGNLVADEFFLHADALASLSRDEIILLATMLRVAAQAAPLNGLWMACMSQLKMIGWSPEKISAVAGRSLRSGFVTTGSGFGGFVYAPSPMLFDVCKTVDFDEALRRERQAAVNASSKARSAANCSSSRCLQILRSCSTFVIWPFPRPANSHC